MGYNYNGKEYSEELLQTIITLREAAQQNPALLETLTNTYTNEQISAAMNYNAPVVSSLVNGIGNLFKAKGGGIRFPFIQPSDDDSVES